MISKPTLYIPADKWQKLMAYVDLVDTEITGFFDVEYDADKSRFEVGEVYLIEQEAQAAHVEMEEEDLSKFMVSHIKAGHDQMPRGWWHSHVNMQAFFSGTDDNTINNTFIGDSFTVSLVVNKSRNYKCSLVIWTDDPYGLYKAPHRIDDVSVLVGQQEYVIPKLLRDEVAKKVKTKVYAPTYPTTWNETDKRWGKKTEEKAKETTKTTGIISKALPKNKMEALIKIDELELIRVFDPDLKEIVYKESATGDLWLDINDVVDFSDYSVLADRFDPCCERCGFRESRHIYGRGAACPSYYD